MNLYRFWKPYGVLTKFTDAEGRPTLADYIRIPGIYAAGRLDADSEGLLLLTDSGALSHRLTDPHFAHPRTYWAQVEGTPDDAALEALRHGVDLGDLIAVNNLDRRATIYVNQTLRIPLPDEKPIMVARLEKIRQEAAGEPLKNPPPANQAAAFLMARNVVSEYPAEDNLSEAQIEAPDEAQAGKDPEDTAAADPESDSTEAEPDAVLQPSQPDEDPEESAHIRMLVPRSVRY